MQTQLHLLSLNIAHGMLADKLFPYLQSKQGTTDVFCIQEVSDSILPALNQLMESAGYDGYFAEKKTDQKNVYYGLATYVSRKHTVLSTHTIMQYNNGPGLALYCVIQGALGRSIAVTNVHGAPQPGDKVDTPDRIFQSESVIQHLRSENIYSIVMGDFNLMPDTQSIAMFEANGYHNLIEEYAIETTRNHITWDKYPSHMKQLHADYAFLSPDTSIDYDFVVEQDIVSDHLPLQLTVTTATPSQQTTYALESIGAE